LGKKLGVNTRGKGIYKKPSGISGGGAVKGGSTGKGGPLEPSSPPKKSREKGAKLGLEYQ